MEHDIKICFNHEKKELFEDGEKMKNSDGTVSYETDHFADLEKALEKIRNVDDFNRVARKVTITVMSSFSFK